MGQWRVVVATRLLSHPTVNGKRVLDAFSMEDAHLIEVLIDDMGGLPCALTELYQVLDTKSKMHGVQMFSFDAVYDWILHAVRARYPMNSRQLASVRLAFLAVLRCDTVVHSSHFEDLSLDKVLACGLMRVQNDRLMCPYVLYLLLDFEASPWEFLEQHLPRKERSDRNPWTTWEGFNVKFRVLKSLAWGEINDPHLRWGNLHEGARCVTMPVRVQQKFPSPGLSQGACGCRHDSDCLYVGMKNEPTSQVVLQDSSLTSEMTTMESVVMDASKVPIPPSVTLSFLSIEVQLYDHHHDEQRPLTIRETKRVKKSAVGPDDYLMVYAMGTIPFQPESLGNCAIVDREDALAYYTVFGKRAVFLQNYGGITNAKDSKK